MTTRTTSLSITAIVAASLFALTGCTSSNIPESGNAQSSSEQSAATMADAVVVEEPWVKAGIAGGMTAAFANVENTSKQEVTIVAATSSATDRVELHEMAMTDTGEMKMRELEGGFVIAAREDLELEPGGYHIMLMDLPADVAAGSEVTITLEFADGSTKEFTALVKNYSAANEEYEEG